MASLVLPVLPVRDLVVYPTMIFPLFLGRARSIAAIDTIIGHDNKSLVLVTQKNHHEDPAPEDIYEVGVLTSVLQCVKMPDGTIKVLFEAKKRVQIDHYEQIDPYMRARIALLDEDPMPDAEKAEAMMRTLMMRFENYLQYHKKIPTETLDFMNEMADPGRIIDSIAANIPIKMQDKQKILSLFSVKERFDHLMAVLESEIEFLQTDQKINDSVYKELQRSQRDFVLQKKMEAIQEELGHNLSEIKILMQRIEDKQLPGAPYKAAMAEVKKIKEMHPQSAESAVSRHYIETLLSIPWDKPLLPEVNISAVAAALEEDHYGLEKVKERIIEYLALQKRVKKIDGSVLCFVGPPGVGKTSLAQSIAKVTGRSLQKIALGGMHDEGEIRGHRRTYIGAMPGRLIQKMIKAGHSAPVILLDELDKMGRDGRGDPAAALLEVLDPEQNKQFNDHYVDLDYDLSHVLFITTANSLDIPSPLLDRLEIIHCEGYTEDEKLHIAQKYLIKKQWKKHALSLKEWDLSKKALLQIIRSYTAEAGVRELERLIAQIARKIVYHLESNSQSPQKNAQKALSTRVKAPRKQIIDQSDLESYLGIPRYHFQRSAKKGRQGRVAGMAWTRVGGDLLFIEAAVVPGKGKIIKTGHLGTVMQESIQAAHTVIRSRAQRFGVDPQFYENKDVHVHVPQGATPKDGPSAGMAICVAIVSALLKKAVPEDVAMTGELNLSGEILAIGGLKEKLLAARRGGIKRIFLSWQNEAHVREIPAVISHPLEIHYIRTIDEVILALFPR